MPELVIANDADLKLTAAAREIAERVGPVLAITYPGYRWHVEAFPHPKLPFVNIRIEAGLACFGYTIKLWQHFSWTGLRQEVVRAGGELLERYRLNRTAFDEAEFVNRPKSFAGLVVPDLG